MNEHDIQNAIRESISRNQLGVSFRTNVGEAWTGSRFEHNANGTLTIFNPRRFQTGLPNGFSDILCVVPTIITPSMFNRQIAQTAFLEVKTKNGRPTNDQLNFIAQMQRLGAKAGVVRSPDEAIMLLRS